MFSLDTVYSTEEKTYFNTVVNSSKDANSRSSQKIAKEQLSYGYSLIAWGLAIYVGIPTVYYAIAIAAAPQQNAKGAEKENYVKNVAIGGFITGLVSLSGLGMTIAGLIYQKSSIDILSISKTKNENNNSIIINSKKSPIVLYDISPTHLGLNIAY